MTERPALVIDGRACGNHGVGRFANQVVDEFEEAEVIERGLPFLHPLEPLWLKREIDRRHPHAFFSPSFNPPLSPSVPFAFTIHDLIHLKVRSESSIRKRIYYRAVVRPAARQASLVLSPSEFSRSEIIAWAGLPSERIVSVPLACGPQFKPDGPVYPHDRPYVLYVGNHKPHKNIPRLLQAYGGSRARSSHDLLLTGKPRATLVSGFRRLLASGRVHFLGTVPEGALPDLYRGADALAIPSLYEGFGLPALEAMASGTPVVSSAAASLPEVVGEQAVFVDPTDVDSIRVGLERICRSPELRETLRGEGLERAKAFSWERTMATVRSLLAKHLGVPFDDGTTGP